MGYDPWDPYQNQTKDANELPNSQISSEWERFPEVNGNQKQSFDCQQK